MTHFDVDGYDNQFKASKGLSPKASSMHFSSIQQVGYKEMFL
jgi:hypothetical protein